MAIVKKLKVKKFVENLLKICQKFVKKEFVKKFIKKFVKKIVKQVYIPQLYNYTSKRTTNLKIVFSISVSVSEQ